MVRDQHRLALTLLPHAEASSRPDQAQEPGAASDSPVAGASGRSGRTMCDQRTKSMVLLIVCMNTGTSF